MVISLFLKNGISCLVCSEEQYKSSVIAQLLNCRAGFVSVKDTLCIDLSLPLLFLLVKYRVDFMDYFQYLCVLWYIVQKNSLAGILGLLRSQLY